MSKDTSPQKILAVSPHLDDAVLSAGGILASYAQGGAGVVVLTLFAGSPAGPFSEVAQAFHDRWGLHDDPVEERRREDRQAVKALGATAVHADFLDSIYRRTPDGDWLVPAGTDPVDHAVSTEESLLADLSTAVADLIDREEPDVVLTCAAKGRHVDHHRARDATIRAAAGRGIPVRLWEDLPYAMWADDITALEPSITLAASQCHVLEPPAWQAKLDAVTCYVSQLEALRHAGASIQEQLDAFASRAGVTHAQGRCERTWDVAFPAAAHPGRG